MELNQLLESSNNFKSLQADAARLADKWSASGLLEGIQDEKAKNNMAMVLENQAKQIVAEANNTGASGPGVGFTAGAGEQWAGVALPLVRKVFAQIVAQDFVSVQPMNLPSGLVFYLDFKYGSNSGRKADGDNMYGNVTEASSKMAVDTDVAGGLYGAGQFGYSINNETATIAATVAAADLADVGYDAELTLADFETVAVTLPADADKEGVRAFSIAGKATFAQYTKVDGDDVVFVTAAGAVADAG